MGVDRKSIRMPSDEPGERFDMDNTEFLGNSLRCRRKFLRHGDGKLVLWRGDGSPKAPIEAQFLCSRIAVAEVGATAKWTKSQAERSAG